MKSVRKILLTSVFLALPLGALTAFATPAGAVTYTALPAHVYAPYYETFLAPSTPSITATAQGPPA